MTVFDELKARGLLAQLTDEEEIKELINNGKATFYIGFDPTADSLHVGHFMALCLMKRMQMAGNKPIALIGGGTAMIGDPSGRSDMRTMMTKETIQHNVDCFKKQMSRFFDFSDVLPLSVLFLVVFRCFCFCFKAVSGILRSCNRFSLDWCDDLSFLHRHCGMRSPVMSKKAHKVTVSKSLSAGRPLYSLQR